MSYPQMQPLPAQLGLFSQLMVNRSESLVVREKALSLSGDSFHVKTTNGEPLLQVNGEISSLFNRTHICDMEGNLLYTIRKKLIALSPSFYAEDANGNVILEVKSRFIGPPKTICTFNPPSGKEQSLLVEGNISDIEAKILDEATGQPVAIVDRECLVMRPAIGGHQTYVVTVAPNVDIALIVAMCICLDER